MRDPKNDFVFKMMRTRRVELLRHMLEGVLGRSIRTVQVIDPDIPGERVRDEEIITTLGTSRIVHIF
jgi:hypothetical protein